MNLQKSLHYNGMNFCVLNTLSKNKTNVNDTFIVDGVEVRAIKISNHYIDLNNGVQYPTRQFNRWVRLHYHQLSHKTAIKNRINSFNQMVKAWQNGFKAGNFTPKQTHLNFIMLSSSALNFPFIDTLMYFATNENIDHPTLLEDFNKEKHSEIWAVESAGTYLTLPYPDKDDRTIIVLFPIKPLHQSYLDSWNTENPTFVLTLKKN